MLGEAWASAWEVIAQRAHLPVALSESDLDAIAAGDVARRRQRLDSTDRAIGATWSDIDRDALWIAILDDTCDTLVDGLTERHLPGSTARRKLLYQHVDAPWPFADRQWVIDIRNNAALAAASGGRVWERTWTLAADGPSLAATLGDPRWPDPDAIWTPRNEGGWLLVDAAGGTLVIYHARVDVGGAIPDGLATTWTLGTLRGMLRHVVDRAAQIPTHYDAHHRPLQRVDGTTIPPW
ncbi:MAG: hypothetical protein D6798_05705 [Deltaproteobacteria bacterium]|nr:MAG: hypothetical protein D6798_05705 [Deltaproteobacteria bacterium]